VAVFDVDGRRVRTLVDATLGAGPHEARWDGADASGRAVGAGVYFVRLAAAGQAVSRRLVRLGAAR
jgi:flagellar hook assembly protein FlgD